MNDWDSEQIGKQRVSESIKKSRDYYASVVSEIDSIYDSVPMASAGDAPEVATMKTKIRTMLDGLKSKVSGLDNELEGIGSHATLSKSERPATAPKVELAESVLKSLREEIVKLIESKMSELE